ncbi:unnamed protein product, partial [Prorocentrum cordatum]
MHPMLRLLAAAAAAGAAGAPIFGGKRAREAAAGWLGVWRAAYQKNDGSVPELKDSDVPAALKGTDSMIVISSGGAAGGVVTEGMGYAIMVEGIHALGGSKEALNTGLALTKGWLGMVYGPPETSMGKAEAPLGGGSGEKGSATDVGVPPYGVSAIKGKDGGYSGMAAWKFPVNQCAPFCHGTATDGDEDALLGMIYLAEALSAPADFVDMVMRAAITFASTDLGFPDIYRSLPDGSRMYVPKGGSDWGGLTPESGKYGASQQPWCYNPSYFAPGHYRVFRDFVQKYWDSSFDSYLPSYLDGAPTTMKDLVASFDGAITAGYNILYHSSCSSGAVSNWVGVKAECTGKSLNCEGIPWATTPYVGAKGTCTASGTTFGSYGPDASRTPWRIAMDYILYEEESTKVLMYDRHGILDPSLEFNAQVYLNRFANQYMLYATCDGGAAGACMQQGQVATFELASAFSMNAPGLTCKNVPNAGQDWWAGFMSYPTFTVFVAPHKNLTARQSAQWQETLAGICDFSGKAPKGGLCSESYFELGQEVISTMIMSGHVEPLYSAGGGPPPPTASTTEFVPDSTTASIEAPVAVTSARRPPATTATTSAPGAAEGSSLQSPFDCKIGLSHWREAWSSEKRAWCCEHTERGCSLSGEDDGQRPDAPTATAGPAEGASTASPKPTNGTFNGFAHLFDHFDRKPTTPPPPANAQDDAAPSSEGGVCCLVGSDDDCATCSMLAEALPSSRCSKSEAACAACGPRAAWCGAAPGTLPFEARPATTPTTAATTAAAAATTSPRPPPPTATTTTAATAPVSAAKTPAPSAAPPATTSAAPPPAPAQAASKHRPTPAPAHGEGAAAGSSRGVCCLVGAEDGCGGCRMLAEALPSSHCSRSEAECVTCGPRAEWCAAGAGGGGSGSPAAPSGKHPAEAAAAKVSSPAAVPSDKPPSAAGKATKETAAKALAAHGGKAGKALKEEAAAAHRAEAGGGGAEAAAAGEAEAAGRCCLASEDAADPCGSCFGSAWSDAGGACGSADACASCGPQAAWCPGGATQATAAADQDDEPFDPFGALLTPRGAPQAAALQDRDGLDAASVARKFGAAAGPAGDAAAPPR